MLIRSSEARPFHGELAICTWNSRALFGVDLVRASAKQSFVQGLIADHDVLGLEEVHGSYEFTKNFDSKLRHSHRCFWSFLENHGAGGVGIIVKLAFMANFASVVQEVLINGRCISVHCVGDLGSVLFVVVHIEPAWSHLQKVAFLQAIRRKTHAQNECLVYIFGDFNFDAADDKAYNLDTGTYSSGDYRLGRLWNESFPEMTEHFQPEYTRAGGTPKWHGVQSAR